MTIEAYPLSWPEGWPHAKQQESSRRFGGRIYGLTIGRAKETLYEDLRRLGAINIIVSSNVPVHRDGTMYSEEPKRNTSPGIAVYFELKKRPLVMATDRFDTVAGNLRSIGLAIEAMRQLDRHGGGQMMERAFAGFTAIAPPDWKKPWREVFGLKPDWAGTADEMKTLFRQKAKQRHSDVDGHDTLMAELNVAYDEAKKELGA